MTDFETWRVPMKLIDSGELAKLRARLAAAEAENKRLRGALKFYAHYGNWTWTDGLGGDTLIDQDEGKKARAALEERDAESL